MPTKFFTADRKVSLSNKRELKSFIESLFVRERKRLGSLSYVFCSDEYLLQVNKDFLQHDYYTDIITFDLSGNGEQVDAEIYISVDRVKENAAELGLPFSSELHRVIFHGALHLCGYKDKSTQECKLMRTKEDYYLKRYFK